MMKAGRELDALIAEKVFGKKPSNIPEGCTRWPDYNDGTPEGWGSYNYANGGSFNNPLPEYSASIEAAWKVVEKMREKKVCINISHAWMHYKTWKYFITVQEINKEPWYVEPQESAPYAICLAALKAVGAVE